MPGRSAFYQERLDKLNTPTSELVEKEDYIQSDEVKVGPGSNNVIMGPSRTEINNEDPRIGMTLDSEGSTVKSSSIAFSTDISRATWDGYAINPLAKKTPSNVVTYYQPVIVVPTWAKSLINGAASVIMSLVGAYKQRAES